MKEQNQLSVIVVTRDPHSSEAECLEALGFTVPAVLHDGESAVEAILNHRPDAVFCDAYLPGIDAFGVIDAVRAKDYQGIFICTSGSSDDTLASKLAQHGADYYIMRPFKFDYLADRIRYLAKNKSAATPPIASAPQIKDKFELEDYITQLMHQIGIPAHIRGHQYIRTAIAMSLKNADLLNAITKQLYPNVADVYKTSPSRVERAIRHAIEVAWGRGDIEVLTAMFGYTIKTSKGKPTNGEFISMMTDRLRLSLKIS